MTAAAGANLPRENTGAVLFRAHGLCKNFGGVRAVRDISFAVAPGMVFAVIGPNGAGKSTLINLMSGIYQPDAGTMSLDGVDLIGMSAQRRARHGLARTFQKIRLFKQLSALENVIAGYHTRHAIPVWQYVFHGAAFRKDARRCGDEAIELLNFVGLSHRAHITAGALAYDTIPLASAGTLEVYCGKVAGVTRNGQKLRAGKEYQYDAAAKRLTIGFDGTANITLRAASSLFASSSPR